MKENTLTPELFDRINGQLKGANEEISILSKKNPDGKINTFKIQLINLIIQRANVILQDKYMPLDTFIKFDLDMLPSNSDVVFIVSQYLTCMEQLRTENIKKIAGLWYWNINGEQSKIRTASPKKLY